MKRLLTCVSLVAAASTAALSATAKEHPKPKSTAHHAVYHTVRVAPADEYFGKLKMSVIGMRNTIKDVGLNIDVDPARWQTLRNKIVLTEDAIHDWQHKYPEDTWLPRTVFLLERMYAKIDSDEGRRESLATMDWLTHDFPKSWYGREARKEIAEGKVGHPPGPVQTPSISQNAAPKPISSLVPGYGNPNVTSNVPSTSGVNTTPNPYPMPSFTPSPQKK